MHKLTFLITRAGQEKMCQIHDQRYETLKEHSCHDPFGSMKEPPAMAEEGEDLGCHESITT